MTKEEKIAIYNSLEEDLYYEMLRETPGDFVDLMITRDRERRYRLVLLLAMHGVKCKIQSGLVFLA